MVFMAQPLFAQNMISLGDKLQSLRSELHNEYQQMSVTKDKISDNYEVQHQKMVDLMKSCNALSLQLYSQKQEYTLDLCFALEKVKEEYEDFNKDRTPYDRILSNLDIEIDRYARLVESLRRLPPEIAKVPNLPDSLAYRNDSLDLHLLLNGVNRIDLTDEAKSMNDSVARLFVLDKSGQRDRKTCLYYSTELLKMYADSRAIIMTDSIHYQEAYLRLKESYDYAQRYYQVLQRRIFIEGQTPWPTILANPKQYWDEAVVDMKNKYLTGPSNDTLLDVLTAPLPTLDTVPPTDTLMMAMIDTLAATKADTLGATIADTLATVAAVATSNEGIPSDTDEDTDLGNWEHIALFFVIVVLVVGLLFFWFISWLLLLPVSHFVKPLKKKTNRQQRRYIALLIGILIFVILRSSDYVSFEGSDMFDKAVSLSNTFLWLLAAIIGALLIRLSPNMFKETMKIYRPTIYLAVVVIGCRAIFVPNSMLNFIFPPVLIVFYAWQLIAYLRHKNRVEKSDRFMGSTSLAITGIALLVSIAGYIFASLLILIWWYFQLAVIHTMTTIWHLTTLYKEKRMQRRIDEYRDRITFVSGPDKEALLFGATWFYDLIKEVVLPIIALMSIPLCFHLALDVFDFDDLYHTLYHNPFYQYVDSNGVISFRISFYAIILLIGLVFVFRYINKALHIIWQQTRYTLFMRKNHRDSIRQNEINLSLGNSIISVLVWMVYVIIVFHTLQIPTGSLGLVAGGFSAGVGLALKDIINNFVYGIQLMTGRLKIGDWIECGDVRGYVTGINYQTTQVETIYGTTVSFLNADLFAKSFTNLTKSNSYEFLKIQVSVAYGTDIQRVRDAIVEAMQVMRTKDSYGREVVEPKKGIYVVVGEFGDNGVAIYVKQYVLAAERIAYIDRAKEVIYNALNTAGITIPFPQRDIHIINNEEGEVS